MRLRLLEFIRCPECRGYLDLHDPSVERVERMHADALQLCSGLCPFPDLLNAPRVCATCAAVEVKEGRLACTSCGSSYPIINGIPRLISAHGSAREVETARTSVSFGYLWSQSEVGAHDEPRAYHFEEMAAALELAAPRGLVMDAGCGDGIDLANHAERPDVEVIGVELSDGGCRTSAARIRSFATAHVVQADLRRLPFAEGTFDRVYSYGVLHHVASPPAAAAELARVSRSGAELAVYLYENFGERAAALRIALAIVNSIRVVTTKCPPRILYAFCQLASPVVYVLFTVPYRLLQSVPGLRTLAAGLPFRHGQGPFRLAGDLYDRFSAPIEYRYNRSSAADLLERTGLAVTRVAYRRGWMVSARQPRELPKIARSAR